MSMDQLSDDFMSGVQSGVGIVHTALSEKILSFCVTDEFLDLSKEERSAFSAAMLGALNLIEELGKASANELTRRGIDPVAAHADVVRTVNGEAGEFIPGGYI